MASLPTAPQEPPLQQFGVEPVGLGIKPAPILSSKSAIETEAGAPFEGTPAQFQQRRGRSCACRRIRVAALA
jgi:hypothetical protein